MQKKMIFLCFVVPKFDEIKLYLRFFELKCNASDTITITTKTATTSIPVVFGRAYLLYLRILRYHRDHS